MVTAVRGIVVAFGVLNLVLATFWLRSTRDVLRSDEINVNLRALFFTRVATYAAIGLCFVLAGIYRSQLFVWTGISAMLGKVVVEGWIRRRERRSKGAELSS